MVKGIIPKAIVPSCMSKHGGQVFAENIAPHILFKKQDMGFELIIGLHNRASFDDMLRPT